MYYSMHPKCNIPSQSVTRSTMQRWQAVMINPSKKVCIEYQPIVLSKTMINLGRCCFHHNRHHPVRTVVAYQTMSVLKVSCPYSTLQAAATVRFLPIYDIAAGWLLPPVMSQMVMFCTGSKAPRQLLNVL